MKKESLKNQAYQIIKEKILRCEYLPNSFLNENILQNELQTSRTPIRDALGRLEQEKLVVILPKKGVMITELSVKEINKNYEARNLIETYSVRNYGHLLPKERLREWQSDFNREFALENLKECIEKGEYMKILQMDHNFHQYLVQPCGNSYFDELMRHIGNQYIRTSMMVGIKVDKRLGQTLPEHLEIIDRLLKEDYTGAADAVNMHLFNGREASIAAIIENGGWKY